MKNYDSIEDFYKNKFNWIPENILNELGHFNVFKLDYFVGKNAKPVPYKRRDFYKIMLIRGQSKVYYADKIIKVKKQALTFSNPHIPYKFEHIDAVSNGMFCIFNQHFFHNFGDLNQYEVFQPNGTHVFKLTDEQFSKVEIIFNKMFEEINSDYYHKYDVLRNLVYELLHFAMKIYPSTDFDHQKIDASQRISSLFMELLERQFPIDENHRNINFRSATDYADQLNIHVNHLNRAIKKTTQKTTTQIIADRLLQEAKVLLRHSQWNVSEIAYSLGFTEVTHFNNFFKKHVQQTPLKFRNV